jgi:hypothetical protein
MRRIFMVRHAPFVALLLTGVARGSSLAAVDSAQYSGQIFYPLELIVFSDP